MSIRQTRPLALRSTLVARGFSALSSSEIFTSLKGVPVQRPASLSLSLPLRLPLATPGRAPAATTATAANLAKKLFMGPGSPSPPRGGSAFVSLSRQEVLAPPDHPCNTERLPSFRRRSAMPPAVPEGPAG